MKCLTLAQPLPSLISHGVVHVLAMDRPTDHRGPIALHASKTQDHGNFIPWLHAIEAVRRSGAGCAKCGCAESMHFCCMTHTECWCRRCDGWKMPDLPLGAIVGTATLKDVVQIVDFGAGWNADEVDHILRLCNTGIHAGQLIVRTNRDRWVHRLCVAGGIPDYGSGGVW
jgi:hypothetical protein